MKFNILQDKLLAGLQSLIGVVPTKSTFPVLANVLIEVHKDKLRLAATDLEIAAVTELDAPGALAGAITVPAKQLFEIVKQLPHSPVEVAVEENKISIKCDKSKFSLIGIAKDEFPKIPEIKKEKSFKLPAATFQAAVKKTLFAVSNDNSRPALCGAMFQINGDKLKVVSTDGRRLALFESLISPVSQKSELLIPPKALNLVSRMLGSDEGEITVRFDESYSQYAFQNTQVFARHIEGPYPDYEKVIPWDNQKVLNVSTEVFASAVRRVAVFSDTFTSLIRISAKKDLVELSSRTADIGEAYESLPAKYGNDPLEIGYNASYLLEILKNIEADEVNLYLNTALSAGLVKPAKQKDEYTLVYLLMPIRLPE
ncbi:DNA polymerase III subunit beta [bacterium]|nr:DNA polymerase III subunit beta [bacterium]